MFNKYLGMYLQSSNVTMKEARTFIDMHVSKNPLNLRSASGAKSFINGLITLYCMNYVSDAQWQSHRDGMVATAPWPLIEF